MVVCGLCGRRADAHWVHGRPGYRCRHGRTSASAPIPGRPKPLYLREDILLARVAMHLGSDYQHDLRTLVAQLKANRTTLTCDAETITIGHGQT
jgi:transposase